MKVLDKGYVELVHYMGSDDFIAEVARISTGTVGDEDSNKRLIHFLLKHGHLSPFEHAVFTFRVKAPIFVARQWFRHRIASYLEASGRYRKLQPEFYIPELSAEQQKAMLEQSLKAYEEYKKLLEQGVPREKARMILPVNIYTEFYWTVNARSLMNFLNLRADSHAQYEIRQYAIAIYTLVAKVMPETMKAFVKYAYTGDILNGGVAHGQKEA